jgi:cation transporter-like permease
LRDDGRGAVGSILANRLASTLAAGGKNARDEEAAMLWTIFVILLVLWLLGFFAFHVTSGFIHLVLVIAVIVLILGLVRRGP